MHLISVIGLFTNNFPFRYLCHLNPMDKLNVYSSLLIYIFLLIFFFIIF